MAEELEENVEKEEKKKLTKEEKKALKEEKKKAKEAALEGDDEPEKGSSKLVIFFVTILIVLIWLGIIGILIKCDVGGFGSTVLSPILKDVPYVNQILPDTGYIYSTESTEFHYSSLEEAEKRIKELERQNDELLAENDKSKKSIDELQKQVGNLQVYKDDEAKFEALKEKFYEEVVFSEDAPDINEYKTFYESIEPQNAEVLYKQVVEQLDYQEDVADYVKAYSSMEPKDAAEIFNTMTDNLNLVGAILKEMSASARGNILAQMDADTAAKVTEIMKPSDNKKQ